MTDDLLLAVSKAVELSGYPFEQQIAHNLERRGWRYFHSVSYTDPAAEKERELDILAYKMIRERRLELRMSCKRNTIKPWIVFTDDASRYYPIGNTLKVAPVADTIEVQRSRGDAIAGLPMFSHKRNAIDFGTFSGKELDDGGRAAVRDEIFSALHSVNYSLYPDQLVFDDRGTIYFFVVVLDGRLFDASYLPLESRSLVDEVDYAKWQYKYPFAPYHSPTLKRGDGRIVDFSAAMYYFGEWMQIEIVTKRHLSHYLAQIEAVFERMSDDELSLFGKPWRPEHFPKAVENYPVL